MALMIIEEPFVKAFQGQLTPAFPDLDDTTRSRLGAILQPGTVLCPLVAMMTCWPSCNRLVGPFRSAWLRCFGKLEAFEDAVAQTEAQAPTGASYVTMVETTVQGSWISWLTTRGYK